MIIREAKVDDVLAIQGLETKLIKQDFEFDSTLDINWADSDKGKKYFITSIESDRSLVLVAGENSKIIGYMVAAFAETPEYMRDDIVMVEIENTYIEKDFRGQGVGTEFYQKVEEWAKPRGANMIFVTANADNKKGQSYYRKMGFKETDVTFQKEI